MRVIVVDDNDLWRGSLVAALRRHSIDVYCDVGEEAALQSDLNRVALSAVDVAILDLRLPPTWSDEGIQIARRLRSFHSTIGIIILSGYEQDVQLHYATKALEDLGAAGGIGYLFKDRTTGSSLQQAVERVARGDLVVDSLFAEEAAEQFRKYAAAESEFTEREVSILELLAQGRTNWEISTALHISVPAVERHLTSIFRQISSTDDSDDTAEIGSGPRRENRRVRTVLEWLRRTGRLS